MEFNNYCKKCPREIHCCVFQKNRGYTFVGIKNTKKIKNKIKKDYDYFLDYSPLPKKIIDSIKNEDEVLEGNLRYNMLTKDNRLLRLKTKDNGDCIFLNKSGKCEIYSIRPNICKMFPFWAIKLLNNKIKIIEHDEYPRCGIILDLKKKDSDVEKTLSKDEIIKIKKLFNEIKKESVYYKENITEFSKLLK